SDNSIFGLWLSLVERLVRDQEAVGSNPTSPTSKNDDQKCFTVTYCAAKKPDEAKSVLARISLNQFVVKTLVSPKLRSIACLGFCSAAKVLPLVRKQRNRREPTGPA